MDNAWKYMDIQYMYTGFETSLMQSYLSVWFYNRLFKERWKRAGLAVAMMMSLEEDDHEQLGVDARRISYHSITVPPAAAAALTARMRTG